MDWQSQPGDTNDNYWPDERTPSQYRGPLVPIAIAVIAGIVLTRLTGIAAVVLLLTAGVSVVAGGISLFFGRYGVPASKRQISKRHVFTLSMLCVTFAMLGSLRYRLVYDVFGEHNIVHHARNDRRLATLRGHIVTEPTITMPSSTFDAFDRTHSPRTTFTIRCIEVLTTQSWHNADGLATVYINEPAPNLRIGQRIQLDCWLSLRRGPDNPGQYDFTDISHARRNLVMCSVNCIEAINILDHVPTAADRLCQLRVMLQRKAAVWLLADIDASKDTLGVRSFLAALLLGRREEIKPITQEAFARTGAIHFLSVSGLHVGLFAAFAGWLCWLMRLPRVLHGLAAMAALGIFLIIVPTRPPVLRAGIICGTYCLAYISRRNASPINLLALSAIVISLWRPVDVFMPGFQLSFVVVLGILLFAVPLCKWQLMDVVDVLLRRPPLVQLSRNPREYLPWWQFSWRYLKRRLWQLSVVSIVAWLVGLPLVAYHFHRIALWSALASVILFPLIFFTMQIGFLKLLITCLVPLLGCLLTPILLNLGKATILCAKGLATLPGSGIFTASPPMWLVLMYYAILLALWWSCSRDRLFAKPIALILTGWFTIFVWLVPFAPAGLPGGSSVIHCLSIGHGCAIVVQLPDGKTIIYDAGSMTDFNLANNTILPFLRSRGIGHIEVLIVSHPDIDHYCGVLDICERLDVRNVYLAEHFNNIRRDDFSRRADYFLLDGLSQLGQPTMYITRDKHSTQLFCSDEKEQYRVEVLWPPGETATGDVSDDIVDNDTSLVVRVVDHNGSILLTGDIGDEPMEAMMKKYDDGYLQSDVLVLPHHGAVTSQLATFVDVVNPQTILCSSGRLRARKRDKIAEALQNRVVLHTSQRGAISVELTPSGPCVHTFY